MEDGYLALRWNNHDTAFKNLFQTLREQGMYTDVSLACGRKLFPVHKFVLSTCSEAFKDIFSQIDSRQHTVVYMNDIIPKDLECILDFMYTGEVHIAKSELGSLLRTAESLLVKGLAVPDVDGEKEDRINTPPKATMAASSHKNVKIEKNNPSRYPKVPVPIESSSSVTSNKRKRQRTDDVSLGNKNIHLTDSKRINLNTMATVSPFSLIEDVDLVQIKKEEFEQYDELQQGVGDGENGFDGNDEDSTDVPSQYFKSEYLDDNYDKSNFSENSEISTAELLQVDLTEEGGRFLFDETLSETAEGFIANGEEREIQRKPFACTICPNTFTRRDNLTNHIKTHLGERPYMCQYCKKCFTRKDYLKQHERIHTGEKPFKCSLCDRAFTRKEGLTDHVRCHSDFKEFACDICNMEFKQKCGLRFHKRNYHRSPTME